MCGISPSRDRNVSLSLSVARLICEASSEEHNTTVAREISFAVHFSFAIANKKETTILVADRVRPAPREARNAG